MQTAPVVLAALESTWEVLRPRSGSGFRPREAVELAAGLFEEAAGQRWRAEDEQAALTWRLEVSPGVVRLRQKRPATPVKLKGLPSDPAFKLFHRVDAPVVRAPDPSTAIEGDDQAVLELVDDEDTPGRVVTGFSKESRLRMMRRLASLDWSPVVASEDELFDATGKFITGVPAMVTLTYPGNWHRWATTARVAKKQLAAFFRRWDRAIGPLAGVWKMETQRRGAPHFHLFARVPLVVEHKVGRGRAARFVSVSFNEWLSKAWFEVVGSGDDRHLRAGTGVDHGEGFRCSDPRRIAAYFAGYMSDGSKEYQHRPPPGWEEEGTGRWWGVRRLETVTATVRVDQQQFVELRRLCRGWVKGQGRRPVRTLASGRLTGATLICNDAPQLVAALARAVGPPGRGAPGVSLRGGHDGQAGSEAVTGDHERGGGRSVG